MPSQTQLLKSLFGSKLVAPLGGKRMRKEIKAAANLRYGPELRDLKKERRISRRQQQRSADWFQDYQDRVGEIQSENQGIFSAAQEQIGASSQAAAAQSAERRAQMEADRAATSNRFGLRADPAAGNVMAAAAEARSRQAASDQARLATQGATQRAYLGGKKLVAAQEGLRAQRGEVDRRLALRQQTRDLKSDMGRFKTDIRRELRGGERQFLSDLLASKLGKKTLAESKRSSQAREAIRREELAAQIEAEGGRTEKERKEGEQQARIDRDEALSRITQLADFDISGKPSKGAKYTKEIKAENEKLAGSGDKKYPPIKVVRLNRDDYVDKLVTNLKITRKDAQAYVELWLKRKSQKKKGPAPGKGNLGGAFS